MTMTSLMATTNVAHVLIFWVCGVLATLGALGMLFSRKPVHSALYLAVTMVNLAVLYVSLDAVFLGMVQIIVYTGAVLMLFVFVMMVVGVDASDSLIETIRAQRPAALLLSAGMFVLITGAVVDGLSNAPEGSLEFANAEYGGNVQGIANQVFTTYLIAFELTAGLLITAGIGAMLLTHRERLRRKRTQMDAAKERMQRYAELGEHPGNRPPPGTYARHNAVDTPALDPDGNVIAASVPASLSLRGSMRRIDWAASEEVSAVWAGSAEVTERGNEPGTYEATPADEGPSDSSEGDDR